MTRPEQIVACLCMAVLACALATPPDRPTPKAIADGAWVPQTDFDGNPTGPAWRFAATSPTWTDPTFAAPMVWPPLYAPGTLWDRDAIKTDLWNNATAWGRIGWVVTRIPSTPTFPIGWLPVGCVCWDGSTYRMRLAGGSLTDVPTVDLQSGKVDTLLAEREVRAVTVKAFVTVGAD